MQLYGLTLVPRRRVSFGNVNPATAREVFIREALVPGALASKGAFLEHNRKLVVEVAELEHKARRQDVLVDDEVIAGFYAGLVPEGIHSLATFERWRAEIERGDPRVLFMTRDTLMRHAALYVTEELFPETLAMAGTLLPLQYRFAPGQPQDGLTLTVPLALLNQIDDARLSWLVPGLIREKLAFLLKALPKALRNRLTPLPAAVTALLEAVPFGNGSLDDALRGWLRARLGDAPPAGAWDGATLPAHLRIRIRVVDAARNELASGRDLPGLRAQLGEAAQLSFVAAEPGLERHGLRSWDFGDLPETLSTLKQGHRLTGYPALVDDNDGVSITLLDTREAAEVSTRAGVVRLLRIALKASLAAYEKGGPGFAPSALLLKPVVPTDRLLADVIAAVCDRAFVGDDALPRSERAFAEQTRRARTRLPAVAEGAFRLLSSIATAHHALGQRLRALPPVFARPAAEVRRRRDALVYPGFFQATPWAQIAHLPRYLAAMERRLAKYPENPARDARHSQIVENWWVRYRERRDATPPMAGIPPQLESFRWSLEELQVSLFAQELKTPFPVSQKRLEKAWADLCR